MKRQSDMRKTCVNDKKKNRNITLSYPSRIPDLMYRVDTWDILWGGSSNDFRGLLHLSFALVSFQFFFELGDGMRDEGVIAKNRRRGGFVSKFSIDLFVGIRVGDQVRQFLRRGDGGRCRVRIGG